MKRKENSQVLKRDRIKEIFNSCTESVFDSSILSTGAFRMIREITKQQLMQFEHKQGPFIGNLSIGKMFVS